MIISAGSLAGYISSYRMYQSLKFLEDYCEFINVLNTNIRYNSYPLCDFIKNYSNSNNNLFCEYLRICLKHLHNGKSFNYAWVNTFSNIRTEIGLSNEQANLIKNFGSGLGNTDVNGQNSHCEYNINIVKMQIKELSESKKSKGKLNIILGTCLGMAIALLLI